MATITKPMALDESFNTTESTSRNQADVLAGIEQAIVRGFGQVANAVSYDNTDSGLTADNVQDAIDEVDDTVDGLVDDVAEISSDIESTQTVSGNPITLTDAAPINAESLVVELEPIQEGSGDPSPTNIRPIIGYTECEVDDVGFNQWDEEWEKGSIGTDGTTYDSNAIRSVNYTPVTPNTNYYLKVGNMQNQFRPVYYDKDKNFLYRETNGVTTFTTPNNCYFIKITGSTNYGAVYNNDICINISKSTGTPKNGDYVPYHSSNATIQFGQTVYGGKSNFTEGGTDDAMGLQDLGALTWTKDADDLYSCAVTLPVAGRGADGLCEAFTVVGETAYVNMPNNSLQILTTGIWVKTNAGYTDGTAFKTAMDGIKLVYDLANHTTISTPPTELKLLKGTNNITTNGTTINLGYQPDNVIGEVKGEIEKCSPNPEFMHFEVNENVVDAIPIIFDEAIHSYTVSGDNWKDKTFLCVECCDMRYGILQLVLSSDMAFVDSCGKALMLYPYMRSIEQYIKITISLGQSYGYEISYQTTNTSSLLDYLKIRVRLFN